MTRFRFLSLALMVSGLVLPGGSGWARGVCGADDAELPGDAVAFVGQALEGTADPATGVLLSPATFRVQRWTEGDGPAEVRVETAVTVEGSLVRATSEGITPRAGERWRIRGVYERDDLIATSICVGSERISGPPRESEQPEPEGVVEDDEPPKPGDDRLLSLAVAAAGGTAIAVAMTRQPARRVTPVAAAPDTTATRAPRPLKVRSTAAPASSGSSKRKK